MSSNSNNIRVVSRFRPQNSIEQREGGEIVVQIDESFSSCLVKTQEQAGQFTFDRIFDWNTKQAEVFETCGVPLVQQCFDGFNSTLFCYGQTGSGKTYTMMGSDIDDETGKGITPRIVERIFAQIEEAPETVEFTVKVSFMEIYMEKIRDLLCPANDNLPVHEDKSHGVFVKGLKEVYVGSMEEVFDAMRMGDQARAVSSTNMNEESSRSHSLFVITITQKDMESGKVKVGKMYLVDLAGSEKVGKTGATGQTLEEAKKINKSLTALGMVINALTDGKASHVPYRDSKLTRILQESLGGNSKTTLIINCSPSSYNDQETISTLRFGTRAKSIKNTATVNVELSPAELKALLKKANIKISSYKLYIDRLEKEVAKWRQGISVDPSEYAVSGSGGGAESPMNLSPSKLLTSASSSSSAEMIPVSNLPTSVPILPDEREEFLRRENELTDQLSDRETELYKTKKTLDLKEKELEALKQEDHKAQVELKEVQKTMAQLQLDLERLSFENKDTLLALDTLKDENSELNRKLELSQKELDDFRARNAENDTDSVASSGPVDLATPSKDIEQVKREKTEKMMREITSLSLGESQPVEKQAVEDLQRELEKITQKNDDLQRLHKALQEKNNRMEEELAELLDNAIAGEEAKQNEEKLKHSLAEFKQSLEDDFKEKEQKLLRDAQEQEAENKRLVLEVQRLKRELEDAIPQATTEVEGTDVSNITDVEKLRSIAVKQNNEFAEVKKSLMRDLQNRCQKVVELEIALDETKEQLRQSSAKAFQRKMNLLERNLDQLSKVQKQLVDQNAALKKNLATAEKKILNRNERIADLERMFHDLTAKFSSNQEEHDAKVQQLELRLTEALEAVNQQAAFAHHRIAKPLRGGGDKHEKQ